MHGVNIYKMLKILIEFFFQIFLLLFATTIRMLALFKGASLWALFDLFELLEFTHGLKQSN